MWENLAEKRNKHYASVSGYLTMLFEGSRGKKGVIDTLEKLHFVNGHMQLERNWINPLSVRVVKLAVSMAGSEKGSVCHGEKLALAKHQNHGNYKSSFCMSRYYCKS